ncbi:MAG: F0F1 ATP synthase subunit gamma, partial [Patescibacteria group bacterium]
NVKQLLPFSQSYIKDSHFVHTKDVQTEYLFEPDPHIVLDRLLPRIIESQIYQAILESDASEHSARMVTMKNATEAADDLISDYTLTYNQLRQNKITTELAEITAGRIALE